MAASNSLVGDLVQSLQDHSHLSVGGAIRADAPYPIHTGDHYFMGVECLKASTRILSRLSSLISLLRSLALLGLGRRQKISNPVIRSLGAPE